MFRDLKLAIKIGGGFAVVLFLTVIIGALTIMSLQQLQRTSYKNDKTSLIVERMQAGTVAGKNFVITKLDTHRAEVQSNMEEIVAMATDLQKKEKAKDQIAAFASIIAGAEDYKKNFNDYAKYEEEKSAKEAQMVEAAGRLENMLIELHTRVPSRGDSISQLVVLLYRARLSVNKYLLYKDVTSIQSMQAILGEQRTNVIAIRNAVSGNADRELIDEIVKVSDAYEKDATDYVTLCADQEVSRQKAADGGSLTSKTATAVSDAAAAKMSSLMGSTILFVIIIIIVAILIGILMAVIITRSITGAMRKGVDFAQLVAGGDLSARLDIDQNDEIGLLAKALQDMLARLTKIVEEVNSAARQVAAGSQQLSSTSQQMSQGATEQAASVEEISSSMEEMTSNIKQNADNALQTEGIARKSALAAEEGGRAVSATVAAMKEIASKIGIIEEIARSTNMLALNASIEAARAGEYGKGFAVVASEVGKLAERSQKEAGEISKLSVESVNIAEQAGNTIDAMIPDIKRTAELVQEISAASNEQNSGAEQINSAILQLDQVVQQNASASEESASMSEELASQADQMQGTMAFFKLGTDRKSATVAPTLPRSETVRSGSALTERASSEGKPREIVSSAKKVLPKTESPKNTEQTPPGEKNTVSKSTEVPRKPLSGIRIMLDDDSSLAGRDSMDKDFQEF